MTDPPRIRVLVVDDDPLVRAGLALLLDGDGLRVVGEAADGVEALRGVAALQPHVVLMDIRMPGMDGLSATEAIRGLPSPPEVIVLTTFHADEQVLRALRGGAAGFLLKDTPPREIVTAIHRVAAGDAQLSPAIVRQLIDHATAAGPAGDVGRLDRLTERELAVARAIGEGLTNHEIGQRLHLSVPTVKGHVTAILDKLGVTNRVQVALVVHGVGPP